MQTEPFRIFQVLLNVGLCIVLKDIIRIGDSIILPGDGASHTEILFRYIVFRPRIGDIITGKIRSCSREGVHGMSCLTFHFKYKYLRSVNPIALCVFLVTLGFFDDILIPPTALQHPSRYVEGEQAWVWEYPVEEGSTHDLYMDIGESIKFRVTGDIFEESSPIGPPNNDNKPSSGQSDIKTPYRILVGLTFYCIYSNCSPSELLIPLLKLQS